MQIDKIYILAINLTQEKVNHIKEKLQQTQLESGVPYEILEGHNGWEQSIPEGTNVYDGWGLGDKTNYSNWKIPVQPGEVGCTLSHINVWKRIVAAEDERCLILEEDFVPEKPIKDLPEPNPDWPFVWDYLNIGRWAVDYSKDIRIDNVYCFTSRHYNTQSYILTKAGAQKFLDYELEKNIIPVDEFINATFIQHPRSDINMMFPVKNVVALGTHVDWFNQDGSPSMVSSHFQKTK